MSDTPTYTEEMPAPVPNDGPSMHDLVAEDLGERKAHGLRKYSTLLQAFNGRPALKDAYEEVLDLAVYLRQAIAEQEAPPATTDINTPAVRMRISDILHAAFDPHSHPDHVTQVVAKVFVLLDQASAAAAQAPR